MSMTEELHGLLSERGVEWSYTVAEGVLGSTYTTEWRTSDGTLCDYSERIDKYPPYSFKRLTLYDITPEQAIAAAMGAGTCQNLDHGPEPWFVCSECGRTYQILYPRYCPNCGRRVVV